MLFRKWKCSKEIPGVLVAKSHLKTASETGCLLSIVWIENILLQKWEPISSIMWDTQDVYFPQSRGFRYFDELMVAYRMLSQCSFPLKPWEYHRVFPQGSTGQILVNWSTALTILSGPLSVEHHYSGVPAALSWGPWGTYMTAVGTFR